jgi:DNA helicase-2/ATP-dependent DNA helicase PcrA
MTPDQCRAATSRSALCYVKAGPGSGKTYLATEAFGFLRYKRYLDDRRGVLGVTFARSARSELEVRVRTRWGARSTAWPNAISTFDELHRLLLRHLVARGLIEWPSGALPVKVDDSWQDYPGATASPGKKMRYTLSTNTEGAVIAVGTASDRIAPKPCFTDSTKLLGAVRAGYCTHAEVRNVLAAALSPDYPAFVAAVTGCLAASYCHIIVDESFDMNQLDATVIEAAINAEVTVTLVGDPWQSLYEFRGASPDRVHDLVAAHSFEQIDMPGHRRYRTREMKALAQSLFDEKPFSVAAAEDGDEFDVVLAHGWNTLWDENRIEVLPMGRPSRLDGSELANCFVILLNEVVHGFFGRDAAGVVEARRKLGLHRYDEAIQPALTTLRDSTAPIENVWLALQAAFNLEDRRWKVQGKRATLSMARLRELCLLGEPPVLGLTIHQSKGLEWDRVLLLNGELSTAPAVLNKLDRQYEDHRSVYVGLTRARSVLRVLAVPEDPHSKRVPIGHLAP